MTYDPTGQQPSDPYGQQPTSGGYYPQQPGYDAYSQQGQQPGYDPYAQQAYQQPGYMPQPELPQGMAVASMVLGIVSIPLLFCCYAGVITAILAIIFGAITNTQINRGVARGKSMAMAGLILGIVAVVLLALLIVLSVVLNYSGIYNPSDFNNGY